MKAKIAATIILVYALILFVGTVLGALIDSHFSMFTPPVSFFLFIGPAIGIFCRINWCRIYLGVWAVFIFGMFVSFSFRADFHFLPSYLGLMLGTGLPVFLLFFYPPLKRYTQNASLTEPKR